MPPEAVIFIGIQATGKSTFYSTRFSKTHVRINLDMLRTRHRERTLLQACLNSDQSFVIDNTNPTRSDRLRYLTPAREHGFRTIGYYFQSRIDEAIERNASRGTDDRVPELGIRGTHAKLEVPNVAEGFDELHYIAIDASGDFSIQPWTNEV